MLLSCPKHVVKRGNKYTFVCRVPSDLSHHFPKTTLWRSLKTANEKDARLLASAEEYRAQQLFMQLRSRMLSREIEKRIVALYLRSGCAALDFQTTGTCFTCSGSASDVAGVQALFDAENVSRLNVDKLLQGAGEICGQKTIVNDVVSLKIQEGTDALQDGSNYYFDEMADEISKRLKSSGTKVDAADTKRLAVLLTDAELQINQVAQELPANRRPLDALNKQAAEALADPLHYLEEIIDRYRQWYRISKANVKLGSITDMEVECRVLYEVCGNIPMDKFNDMDTVVNLKKVLRRFPKNRRQRYGASRSIYSIIKSESGYEVINPKTANEYLKRAKSIVDFAGKHKMVNGANVWAGELFQTKVAAEEQREAYDNEDIGRLVDALCTQRLSGYNPRPERFWVILIALFHGLRLSNIIALTKNDIRLLPNGLWAFMLRQGKTKATIRPVAICDYLLLMGFLEWVERLDRENLFLDSSDSFSKWYNRTEKGRAVHGFEHTYVTTNPKKCLYSLRHTFAGNVQEITGDLRVTADMLGHSTAGNVTARYTKETKAHKLKEVSDAMEAEGLDLNRLEARAKELFGI